MKSFLDDGDQDIDRHGDPDLCLHGIFGGAIEALDAQVLLDPFEEQLHLPAAAIEVADGHGRQGEMVGEKHQRFVGSRILETDAAKMFREMLSGIKPVERNGLVADKTGSAIDRCRVEATGVEIGLGAGDEEGASLMQGMQTLEVEIATVHDVEGAGFWDEQVERVDIVHFAVGDMDKAGNAAAQVEQSVQLDGCLGGAKRCPREHRQAQVDGGGVERVNSIGQVHCQRIAGIEAAGVDNQSLRQLGIDAPVAPFVGIGQGGAADRLAKSGVIQLGRLCRQTHLDVAQTLSVGQLRKGHAAELVGTGKRANPVIAPVALDNAMEGFPWQKLHDLGEQGLANIHTSLQPEESRKGVETAGHHSSRGHLENRSEPHHCVVLARSCHL